ncbi:putative ribonuclease H-like domain-containing protein [Tanacetum coccineum]
MKKMYCLVVTDDYSRFSWVFFLATKDETSEILKTFITGIENLIDLKVKVIRCDNETEFKNKVMNQFYEMKGIKREFSVARTPQQNGVAERKNKTLIEATRTMLADSKFPTTFWAKAFNTACYVQNRVLVIKPHNKTSYELFLGRKPSLSFIRPFGCPVTILNTLDHLGKFDGKTDEWFFVRYSTNSKAYRVFNNRTRIVEENLHVKFSEETPNIAGNGPNWLFDIDALTISMNYKLVVVGNQTNGNEGTKENIDAGQDGKKIVPDQEYILLPLLTSDPSLSKSSKDSPDAGFKPSGEEKMDSEHPENEDSEVPNTEEPRFNQEKDANVNNTNNINAVCPTVNAADIENNDVDENIVYGCIDDLNMPNLEEIVYSDDDEEVGAEADMNNLATTVPVSPIPTTRVHKDHPLEQIIRDIHLAPQTRRMTKNVTEHVEPKKVIQALTDPSWIEAMQDELLQFKLQKVWTLVDLPYDKRAIVVAGNQTNGNASTKENIDAGQAGKNIVPDQEEEEKMDFEHPENKYSKVPNTDEPRVHQEQDVTPRQGGNDANVNNTNNINTLGLTANAADIENNVVDENIVYGCIDDRNMPNLEEIVYFDDDEKVGAEADMNNLATTVPVSPIPTTRVHKDHPLEQIIRDIHSVPQTRRMTKNVTGHVEPKRVYINKKDDRGIVVRTMSRLMDVKSAFLYGTIEEEVYVCQPLGFEDPEFPNKVYKVEKALYGLHQAPRAWYETLSTYLLENRFRRGTIDKTLFIKKDKDDILLVQVYVDDIIFGSTKKSLCTEFEQMMHKRFQMSSMGELTFFLGLQVKQKDDGIFISQDKYVADILKKFDFATVKTASTPMETNKALLKDEEAADVDVHLYRSMIGSLMYLTASRPDIMFVVCACARFQVTPKTSHLHAVKRIFRYLKGHPKLGLWYPRDSPFDLEAFFDSDYAGACLHRKSITGGYQFLRRRLISWQCKKQTIVANSTTEAEYVVAANCHGQVHIEIRHHFIKDSYEKRLIQVIKIHIDHNVADLLTKAFDVSIFQYLIARYLEWNGTTAKDEFQVSAVRVTYYWQVYLMLLVAFNTVVKIKNVEPIKQKWVKDETIIKEWEDKMERAATTASSLEAEQDSGNINRTQSMATLNESFPQGTDSGSGPRCQDTILGVQKLKFDLRLHLNKSYDPPLSRVNTLGSREDNMKLKELMEFCTKLSVRALDV